MFQSRTEMSLMELSHATTTHVKPHFATTMILLGTKGHIFVVKLNEVAGKVCLFQAST